MVSLDWCYYVMPKLNTKYYLPNTVIQLDSAMGTLEPAFATAS